MGRDLILDTGALIALSRGRLTLDDLSKDGSDLLSTTTINVAEFMWGPRNKPESTRARQEMRWFDGFRADLDVLDYTSSTAENHAILLAHTHKLGEERGAHDLIIAAHARETGRTIITSDDGARFADLPGVHAIEVTIPGRSRPDER